MNVLEVTNLWVLCEHDGIEHKIGGELHSGVFYAIHSKLNPRPFFGDALSEDVGLRLLAAELEKDGMQLKVHRWTARRWSLPSVLRAHLPSRALHAISRDAVRQLAVVHTY